MCHLYPYNNVKLLQKFFFTLIFAVLLVVANFYMRPVLDNSYLQFKFQLPTSDSTPITAGGPKVP